MTVQTDTAAVIDHRHIKIEPIKSVLNTDLGQSLERFDGLSPTVPFSLESGLVIAITKSKKETIKSKKDILIRVGLEPTRLSTLADSSVYLKLAP